MRRSDDLKELIAAMVKAQAQMPNATRDKQGMDGNRTYPYATLASVIDTMREPFTSNGLCHWQCVRLTESGEVSVETFIAHVSGQMYSEVLARKPDRRDNVKGLGSEISYLKRYALMAMAGIAAEEDDEGIERGQNAPRRAEAGNKPPMPTRRAAKEAVKANAAPEPTTIDAEPETEVPFEDHEGENQCAYMLPGEAKSLQAAIDQDMSAASEKGADAVNAAWELHRASIALLPPDAQAALKKKGQELLGVNRRAGKEAVAQHEGQLDPTPSVGPPTPPPAGYDMPDIPPILDRRPNGGARK